MKNSSFPPDCEVLWADDFCEIKDEPAALSVSLLSSLAMPKCALTKNIKSEAVCIQKAAAENFSSLKYFSAAKKPGKSASPEVQLAGKRRVDARDLSRKGGEGE
jgi:hypothetical protein